MGRKALGEMVTPGGGAGNATPQTITGTVQSIGPLPEGEYIVEGDVEMYAINGATAIVTPLVGSQAALVALGTRVPAKTTVDLVVAPGSVDGYVWWVKAIGAADGTNFRCNRSDRGRVV